MLVNPTLQKSTVKHYAKYEITHIYAHFMIFTQTWAGQSSELQN